VLVWRQPDLYSNHVRFPPTALNRKNKTLVRQLKREYASVLREWFLHGLLFYDTYCFDAELYSE